MSMKKMISASLALVMSLGVLAGCSGGGKKADTEEFKDSDATLTLKWMGYPVNNGAEEGTIPELTLEETFNVEIEPLFYAEDNYQDQKTTLLASGNIPDLIYELDPMYLFRDADKELVVPVSYETIEEFAPSVFDYINHYVPGAWAYSRFEDQNWGVPNWNHAHMSSRQAVYRGDWLEKIGEEVPVTLDEFHTVLKKFAQEDPDGNGKNDTYGITAASASYSGYFDEIFAAFGCLPFDWQEAEDGSIVYGGMTDECKEALETLATWYKEGIVYPDFALGQNNANMFTSGKLGYIKWSGFDNPESTTSLRAVLQQANPNGKLAVGFLPEGPDGQGGGRGWGRACHVVAFGRTEGYGEKVPRILKMMEAMFTDTELYTKLKIGNEGEQYEWDRGSLSSNAFTMLGDYSTSDAARINGLSTTMGSPGMFTPIPSTYDFYVDTFSDAFTEFMAEWNREDHVLTDVFFKPDIVPSAADYFESMCNTQMAVMTKIIKGEVGIDGYSEFEKAWYGNNNDGGGAIMEKEAAEVQAELKEIYKEIGIDPTQEGWIIETHIPAPESK